MSSDPNKKSGRTFQCRDVLWETFEQMARELECSVDYLINEAMKQYARQRSYGSRTPFPGQGPNQGVGQSSPTGSRSQEPPPSSEPHPQGRGGYAAPAPQPAAARPPRGGGLPAPPARVGPPPMRTSTLPAPPQGGMGAPRGMGLPTPPPRGGMQMPQAPTRSAPPPAPRSVPPPIPRGMPGLAPAGANGGFPSAASHAATLSVVYQGEKAAVTKDRFIIGRGKQSSDLTLKDPNVSRQHAMIEFQNGVYFMVDMGSTNGVEYNGQRIARKQIAEGDTFRICDHDLYFTYR
jgi:neural Wiskott-Aldrich syndrome protein